ncbi:MAG: hypothetical protein LQ352_003086 [Teloschistes flavicans]|nr:MAG: hypothetical protein LQ352_003086 [Teloschistes flavicans]
MTDAAQPLGHTNQQSGTLPGQGLRFGTNTETSSLATNPPYVPKTAPIPLPAPPQISSAIEAEAHASPKPPFETVTKFMGPKTNLQPSPKADEELQALDDNATLQTEKTQNPYALEATREQRFAAELETEYEECLPVPILTRTRKTSAASTIVEEGLVGLLKKARRNTIDLIEGLQELTGDTF